MKRLLTLWMTLFAAFWFTRTVTSALLVQEVGRDFGSLFQLVAIPVLQTLVIGWLTRQPGRPGRPGRPDNIPLLPPLRPVLRHPGLAAALALDLVAAALSWRNFTVLAAWAGLKLLIAGVLAVRTGRRWIAALLLACGPSIALGVPRYLAGYLLPEQPALARWLAVYAPLAVLGVGLILQLQKSFGEEKATAVRWLDTALALGLLAGMAAVLGLFARPYLAGPGGFAAALCAALAGTALLAALLLPEPPIMESIESGHDP